MKVIEVKDYNEMSRKACSIILDTIKQLDNPILGLATGSTPVKMYEYLIEAYERGEVSFKNVRSFNLDEYVGLSKHDPNSYRYYMEEKLFNHVDISPEHTHLPNGNALDLEQECRDYEEKVKEAGNVHVQVLGLGLNGHIGFNEPGTPFQSRTHVVDLADTTRRANARFFDSIDEVPSKAITMGIGTIMESDRIILLVSGEKKAEALHKLINGEVTEDFPASVLQKHKDVVIIADGGACHRPRNLVSQNVSRMG
ncbi:glucosamine-6-phosphate deaminase [Salirhabdus euzebyi]|uniref:Glucosamine-6-phosphate deaminase n=1 Tax=Salirhabdus euzebyi TaxID=394506 RepID=A0A841Q871_9BACI|nr:glucosamine-6-phosphate deaminase [Salirhabdus euzebyi]MBB6454610.1 glucosamine-6-phosphate deaminase [Salirhabdus euzebyi]